MTSRCDVLPSRGHYGASAALQCILVVETVLHCRAIIRFQSALCCIQWFYLQCYVCQIMPRSFLKKLSRDTCRNWWYRSILHQYKKSQEIPQSPPFQFWGPCILLSAPNKLFISKTIQSPQISGSIQPVHNTVKTGVLNSAQTSVLFQCLQF